MLSTLPRRSAATVMALILAVAAPASAQTPGSLQLVTESGATTEISLDSLRHLPQVEIHGQIHGSPEIVFRGPALYAVLALAGAPQGSELRGKALRLAALAEARDGYAVVYSLGELSPDLGDRQAILAIEQDGQPLSEKDGPIRIVLEGEKRPARWIRQLERIRIVRVGT